MPSRSGRRRRGAALRPAATASQPAAAEQPIPLPSKSARATGVLIAAITGALAAGLIVQGANEGGSEGIVRMVVGALLVGLAVIVGLLSLIPRQIAEWVRRRRR